ncbi:hypothetical protein [Paraburkholderia sp. BL17N1]|uniref:hypothetical protein n=1 Tax=Paraburkholderia sp. BL17N1 TaxID=1938798 RepID=UPI0011C48E5E|nr:hypothetical protein [Paraburkholderia sp. BL17N1]
MVIGKEISGANYIVQRMLNKDMPAVPNLFVPIVDVRDVADAHIRAMTHSLAAGERFLLSNGPALPLKEIGAIIKANLGHQGSRVPTRTIPDFVLRTFALFNAELRAFIPDLGHAKRSSNEKAKRVLGWTPRASREPIVAAARSMIEKGLIKV